MLLNNYYVVLNIYYVFISFGNIHIPLFLVREVHTFTFRSVLFPLDTYAVVKFSTKMENIDDLLSRLLWLVKK